MSQSGSHSEHLEPGDSARRKQLFRVIFESDTPGGRLFDLALIVVIAISVLAVLLESVTRIRLLYGAELRLLEWAVTLLFSVEYLLRLWCVRQSVRYVRSFFGMIDLLALLPTYLSLFFAGGQYLLVIRAVRLLRVFRILKMVRFVGEAQVLVAALRASAVKITVFLCTVLTLVTIIGALMYLIEGPKNGFTSIPVSIYWTIVTLTTVGYGDIAPKTILGQVLACMVMILGYGIIAVPTGIVSVELANVTHTAPIGPVCPACGGGGHSLDARYCKYCAAAL